MLQRSTIKWLNTVQLSDHFPILVKLDMKNKFSDPKFIEIKYRNFKKYNHEAPHRWRP